MNSNISDDFTATISKCHKQKLSSIEVIGLFYFSHFQSHSIRRLHGAIMFEYLSLLILEGYQIKLAYILYIVKNNRSYETTYNTNNNNNNNNNNYYFHNCLLHQFS